jgi:isopenicillin N synthase-like dioxygenase
VYPDTDPDLDLVCRAVSNHGIEQLVERHFAETRKFFQLPQAFKEEVLVDSNSR